MNTEAKYTLKINEAVLMPTEMSKAQHAIRASVLVILGVIVFGSLMFGENLLREMSWLAKALLISVILMVLFWGPTKEYTPSPIELRFYEDRLVLYRPKRCCTKRISRREFCEMKYTDITKCSYKAVSKRIHFYGNGVSKWYYFNKAGELPAEPSKIREYTSGLLCFSTRCAENVDFAAVIETHSPIKVIIEED